MEKITKTSRYEILKWLNPIDILQSCKINKSFEKLCNEPGVFKRLMKIHYPHVKIVSGITNREAFTRLTKNRGLTYGFNLDYIELGNDEKFPIVENSIAYLLIEGEEDIYEYEETFHFKTINYPDQKWILTYFWYELKYEFFDTKSEILDRVWELLNTGDIRWDLMDHWKKSDLPEDRYYIEQFVEKYGYFNQDEIDDYKQGIFYSINGNEEKELKEFTKWMKYLDISYILDEETFRKELKKRNYSDRIDIIDFAFNIQLVDFLREH